MNLFTADLVGRLTRAPELRHVGTSGTPVCTLAVANNYRIGEVEHVQYVDVECWGKLAESCAASLITGSPVLVKGDFQARQYKTRNDELRMALTIVARTVLFLESKAQRSVRESARPVEVEGTAA